LGQKKGLVNKKTLKGGGKKKTSRENRNRKISFEGKKKQKGVGIERGKKNKRSTGSEHPRRRGGGDNGQRWSNQRGEEGGEE